MAAVDTARSEPSRGFFLNDPVVRGVIYQIVTAVLVVGFAVWIIGNTAGNLAAQNKTTGFDFLWRTAGFDISFSLLPWSRSAPSCAPAIPASSTSPAGPISPCSKLKSSA